MWIYIQNDWKKKKYENDSNLLRPSLPSVKSHTFHFLIENFSFSREKTEETPFTWNLKSTDAIEGNMHMTNITQKPKNNKESLQCTGSSV